jgi:hypothetical protein
VPKFRLVRTLARIVQAVLRRHVGVVERRGAAKVKAHGSSFELEGLGRTDPGHGHAEDDGQEHKEGLLEGNGHLANSFFNDKNEARGGGGERPVRDVVQSSAARR